MILGKWIVFVMQNRRQRKYDNFGFATNLLRVGIHAKAANRRTHRLARQPLCILRRANCERRFNGKWVYFSFQEVLFFDKSLFKLHSQKNECIEMKAKFKQRPYGFWPPKLAHAFAFNVSESAKLRLAVHFVSQMSICIFGFVLELWLNFLALHRETTDSFQNGRQLLLLQYFSNAASCVCLLLFFSNPWSCRTELRFPFKLSWFMCAIFLEQKLFHNLSGKFSLLN